MTQESEVIEFCVDNKGRMPILLEYNITMNVYNNDHARVADKEHLSMYEQDIVELEKLTREMEDENVTVVKRASDRKLKTGSINSLVSSIGGIAVIFIILVKSFEILYLRKKLKDKKML